MPDVAVSGLQRGGGDRTEVACERYLRVVIQLLVVEHDRRVAIDGLLDGQAIDWGEFVGDIDAGDLGEEVGTGWRNRDAHNRFLRL
jgi:hypothetical protein